MSADTLDAVIVIRTSKERKRQLENEARKAGKTFSQHVRDQLKKPTGGS